ncbi:unnamed protein product, partial [Polarella glacialis]
DGPYGTFWKVVYVTLFFGAGAFALHWLSRSLDEAAAKHDAAMQELLASHAAQDEAEDQTSRADAGNSTRRRAAQKPADEPDE